MSSRLNLNTDTLKEKEENYSSLTDLNDLQLFTDEYELTIEMVQKEEISKEKSLINRCFIVSNEKNMEEQIISNMFMQNSQIVLQVHNDTREYGTYYVLLGSILFGLLISTVIFGITGKKGNRKK